ncbi:hypothetical protein [Cohnella yongneupensis]|uniref:Uncharacterized protein n=1 Tax=Cohnella yongneupensis TaxID=425006 RepID=A0ABW0QWQ9_9BACL
MPRTNISVVDASPTGTTKTYVAADAANGMEFVNTGEEFLEVKNGAGASMTVTIVSVPCSHGRTGDLVITVGAGAEVAIGPFVDYLFNQSNGKVNVNFSSATSITVAAVKR